MSSNFLITCLFGLPIAGAAVQLLQKNKLRLTQFNQSILSILMLLIALSLFLSGENTVVYVSSWPAPYGISLVFNQLTTFMLLIFALVAFSISLYSFQDPALGKKKNHFYVGFWILILGVTGALSTYDVFNLYVWAEVMLVSAFILLSAHENKDLKAIYAYTLLNIVGTLLMLLGVALLYGITGNLNYAAVGAYIQNHPQSMAPIIMLFLLGLGIKGALFPFYFWLPTAYPKTSNSSTLLLSSLITKVVMLVLLKLVWLWELQSFPLIQAVFIFLACATMLLGVLGAASYFKMKEILSFHIVSQLGYILLVIFIPTALSIVAALYFLIHNIFVKTNLLMTAGIAEQHYKTHDLNELGSVLKACPLLAAIFFISAMSLAGIPPFSGFWGKLLIIETAYINHFYIGLFFAVFVSLFTLYSMIKIWRFGFCKPSTLPKQKTASFHLSPLQKGALLPLFIMPLIFGLYPDSILPTLNGIAEELNQSQKMTHILGGKDS